MACLVFRPDTPSKTAQQRYQAYSAPRRWEALVAEFRSEALRLNNMLQRSMLDTYLQVRRPCMHKALIMLLALG